MSSSIPFEELASSISGQVIRRSDPDFDSNRKHWNTFADRPMPAIVVCPKTISDVQSSILFAKQYKVAVVVKNGGHSYRSSQENAMVIDMKHFDEVKVDQTTGVAKVGGGVTLGDLDAKSAPWHIPVGIFHSTGAAGLIVHGGVGFLSRTKGFSVDNILGAKVVTADGTVLSCNKDHNSDLFWAIRGAGSAFGVVVELTMQAHKITESWATMVAWPMTLEALNTAIDWSEALTDDRMTAYVLLSHTPDKVKAKVVIMIGVFLGPAGEANKLMEPIMATNPIPLLPPTPMPFTAIQLLSKEMSPNAYWYLTAGAMGGSTMSTKVREALIENFKLVPNDLLGAFALELRGGAASRMDSSLTCAPADRNHAWDWVVMLGTFSEEREEELTEVTRKARDSIRSLSSLTDGLPAGNTNHKFHSSAEGAYGANLPKLRQIKGKYDPTNFFKGLIDLMS